MIITLRGVDYRVTASPSPSIMTNPKDCCIETTPISVSSGDSRKKEGDDKVNEDTSQRRPKPGVDSALGLPLSENRESVSGDIPHPQQSKPLEPVEEKNITLKQKEPATEPSQGTDNVDEEDVIRLNEALSRLSVKGNNGPQDLSGCSHESESPGRAPEKTSLGSSVDPESYECGSKGKERLSESSLESDGNVSDDERDIDSDGISSMSDSSLPQDSREQLVERGPARHRASQPRYQGKPYDRQPASPYVVTPEQDDDLMNLIRSSHCSPLPQLSSPQGSSDQTYVDSLLDDISNDQSQNASQLPEIGDSGQSNFENFEHNLASFDPAHTSGQRLTALSDPNIFPSSNIANFPNTATLEYSAYSVAPMQSTIPTVVKDKMEEQETNTRKRTPRRQKNTTTPRKQKSTPRKQKGTRSASISPATSECRPSVQHTSDQQQTPVHMQPGLSPDQGFEVPPASSLFEDAMSFIESDLRHETDNGTSVAPGPPEVSQAWSQGSGIQMSHMQMPLYPAQPLHQFPIQNPPIALPSQSPTPHLPPVQSSVPFQVPIIFPTNDVGHLAVQSTCQQHIPLGGQPQVPPPTSTRALSIGTGQSQQLTSQPTMMSNTAGLRYLMPSSSQHKLTTAGTLGATSGQLYAFSFQPVRPVVVPNRLATQTGPNISYSRFRNIVPKPT